jgi:hypothetical protein
MNMTETIRKSRESESRAAYKRPAKWQPPRLLPDPTPEPGYAFRWVRVSMLNKDDPTNISSKFGEGWEPVKASDHPEVQVFGSGHAHFPDSILIGGLMLCKAPEEFMQDREAHFRQKTEAEMAGVDNTFMRENDPRMPMFKERSTKVTFGKGF